MTQITDHLADIRSHIDSALKACGRRQQTVRIVAVSKQQPLAAVIAARAAGLRDFGENYAQEGLAKIEAIADPEIDWHFIGRIQANKTKGIAAGFDWVQTVDRERIADRLSAHRPSELGPLNVLIQLNLEGETQKGGVGSGQLLALAEHIAALPRLRLRGVMTIPPAANTAEENRRHFLSVAEQASRLKDRGIPIDTLSMGMSGDYALAVECGANCVRIGTALFGHRTQARG